MVTRVQHDGLIRTYDLGSHQLHGEHPAWCFRFGKLFPLQYGLIFALVPASVGTD